jgi:predicted Fe-Mo cluster-binding NifX family protein
MRIAISIWEDKISPVLDTASKLLIIENETEKEPSRFEAYLFKQDISKRCHFIRDLNIQVLICGAVSRQLSEMLKASEIEIISSISGPVEDVLEAYQRGALLSSEFFMPGCKNNHLEGFKTVRVRADSKQNKFRDLGRTRKSESSR